MANLFSILRFPLALLALYFLLSERETLGIIVLITAALTDFFDGYIARKFDQVTKFGTLIDPIADRFLVACTCIALVVKFWHLPIFRVAALLLLSRELLIATGFLFLRNKEIQLQVSMLGKVSTAFVFTSFVITFVLPKQGIYILLMAVIVYFASAIGYIVEARRQIAQKN